MAATKFELERLSHAYEDGALIRISKRASSGRMLSVYAQKLTHDDRTIETRFVDELMGPEWFFEVVPPLTVRAYFDKNGDIKFIQPEGLEAVQLRRDLACISLASLNVQWVPAPQEDEE